MLTEPFHLPPELLTQVISAIIPQKWLGSRDAFKQVLALRLVNCMSLSLVPKCFRTLCLLIILVPFSDFR